MMDHNASTYHSRLMEQYYISPAGEEIQVAFGRLIDKYPGVYTYQGKKDSIIFHSIPIIVCQSLPHLESNTYLPFIFEHYNVNLTNPIIYD